MIKGLLGITHGVPRQSPVPKRAALSRTPPRHVELHASTAGCHSSSQLLLACLSGRSPLGHGPVARAPVQCPSACGGVTSAEYAARQPGRHEAGAQCLCSDLPPMKLTLKREPWGGPQRKRVGRGIGSGMGKTSTRGHKGQKARSGAWNVSHCEFACLPGRG